MPLSDSIVALAADLGELLRQRGWRITTAESCTGGLVAGAITAIPGSSGWFDVGFVSYSNDAKRELLDVPEAALRAHGAVSEQVARAMAAGALSRASADIAVAVTGVAGPTGGTPTKPVGIVCLAWSLRRRVDSTTRRFDGDRTAIREASVVAALEGSIERVRAA
jgi:nicotinamide-nucleotide amidase